VSEKTRAESKAAVGKAGAAVPIIDVTRVGFHKVSPPRKEDRSHCAFFLTPKKKKKKKKKKNQVLGKGFLPQQPFVVRAKLFSKGAETKIRKAGGVAELVG
jgi:ribosomal protein L15